MDFTVKHLSFQFAFGKWEESNVALHVSLENSSYINVKLEQPKTDQYTTPKSIGYILFRITVIVIFFFHCFLLCDKLFNFNHNIQN